MSASAESFVALAVASGCLRFGDFTLKSGRKAPYFFDLGRLHSGHDLDRLGRFYAEAILETAGEGFDLVVGPAYKGIPLATATVIALARDHGVDKPVAFDRKETKTHGEKGKFLGRVPQDGDRIIIVDDVITTGGTKDDLMAILSETAKISLTALVVGIDRRERDDAGASALAAFGAKYQTRVRALATAYDVLSFLKRQEGQEGQDDHARALASYLEEHGCGA